MKTLKLKAERYQYNYPNGKETGVLGINREDDTEIIVNLDNFIMAVGHWLYFKFTENGYIDMLVDEESLQLVKTALMYSKH